MGIPDVDTGDADVEDVGVAPRDNRVVAAVSLRRAEAKKSHGCFRRGEVASILMKSALTSTQSLLSLSLINFWSLHDDPDTVSSWHVMPSQHLSQDPPSARHSARLAAVLYLRAVHTLLRTYLSVAHLVAVVPSHVEPLGQAVHTLLRT